MLKKICKGCGKEVIDFSDRPGDIYCPRCKAEYARYKAMTPAPRKPGRPRTAIVGQIFKKGDHELNFNMWGRTEVDLVMSTLWSQSAFYGLKKKDIQTIIDKLEAMKGEMK